MEENVKQKLSKSILSLVRECDWKQRKRSFVSSRVRLPRESLLSYKTTAKLTKSTLATCLEVRIAWQI